MNPYQQMAADYAGLLREGRSHPLGTFDDLPRPAIEKGAPTAMLFSPHPDDEIIFGGLPLRLMRECGWRIVNVAVTQGSNKARQAGRWKELQDCCRCIGFEVVQTAPDGLTKIRPETRTDDPGHWQKAVAVITDILEAHRPQAVFFPHDQDWNSTHVGTHHLVVDALAWLPGISVFTVETEFWGQMATPNLMVELGAEHLGDLITALTFHVEEVRRNPYHLTLPAWMTDNVRRGAELVGGQGGASPDYLFAVLHRFRRWHEGSFRDVVEGGRLLGLGEVPDRLFTLPKAV